MLEKDLIELSEKTYQYEQKIAKLSNKYKTDFLMLKSSEFISAEFYIYAKQIVDFIILSFIVSVNCVFFFQWEALNNPTFEPIALLMASSIVFYCYSLLFPLLLRSNILKSGTLLIQLELKLFKERRNIYNIKKKNHLKDKDEIEQCLKHLKGVSQKYSKLYKKADKCVLAREYVKGLTSGEIKDHNKTLFRSLISEFSIQDQMKLEKLYKNIQEKEELKKLQMEY